ncbi:MAG: HlyC/CorC family transporter [Candidatus Desulfofervidaceae bacterium]|nr:HlyC/CorC family transporter [Candidatus Desulfofervidaceae bacterium]
MDEDSSIITRFLQKIVYYFLDRQLQSPEQFKRFLTILLQKGQKKAILSAEEARIIVRSFKFRETTVKEIMVPAPEMVCAEEKTPLSQIVNLIIEKGHTRLPIYRDNLDNIIGILHAKKLLRLCQKGDNRHVNLAEILLPPFFVPDTKKISILLKEMNLRHMHLAIVVDEYGSTVGLVTLEDIIEEIFGEIQDEYDEERVKVVEIDEHKWRVQANINLEELEEILQTKFPEGKYETLAGFLIHFAGRVPKPKEVIKFNDLEFTIVAATPRRLQEVLIKKKSSLV